MCVCMRTGGKERVAGKGVTSHMGQRAFIAKGDEGLFEDDMYGMGEPAASLVRCRQWPAIRLYTVYG